ncbi:MAG: histidine--tRNA ligase [Coriobacteriaceae bacterium]|nr:histidine--tRNA ligase [Coriobacteriaceae bacterium]
MNLQAPRGTTDLLPEQALAFNVLEQTALDVFSRYGYALIEVPTFEQLDVFVRGIGQSTDVIGKEMFFVYSMHAAEKLAAGETLKADERLALRPEATAGVARAVVEHNLVPPGAAPAKFWYAGSMFRHERPQKGRLREFHQIGAECIGAAEPTADAEVIIMLMRFFEAVGIPRQAMRLLVNSMGDEQCRPAYREKVREFIVAHSEQLCADCVRRAGTNPLRAFDCKNLSCQQVLVDAPKLRDELCDDCRQHYQQVKDYLTAAGLSFEEAPRLVRGLDYYTRTVFEVQVVNGLGSQNAIGGGGRYDRLIEEFGGKPTPGLGFAVGMERIQLALEANGCANRMQLSPQVFIVVVGAEQVSAAFDLALRLRDANIRCELDHQARSLKSQFKLANKLDAQLCVIIGPEELAQDEVKLRMMETGDEQTVASATLTETIRKILP